jgi:FdrA protein
MSILISEVRRSAYHDSVVLMQLQSSLDQLPGILESGVVMATEANLSLLAASGLLTEESDAGPDDLLVVVKAESEAAGQGALEGIDELLTHRHRGGTVGEYRPHSLEAAVGQLPEARWVLVSVPGRYAAGVAHQALDLGRHVFLYSDNVSLEDEIALKHRAREKGLLVMGPDCGTAVVGGVGLGFANRVERGGVGLVGASGTGLQAVMCHVHALGAGVSHALGTGGRDLGDAAGASTALAALQLLAHDPATEVIALVAKPPAPAVAARLLTAAQAVSKPVVVGFLGYAVPTRRLGNLRFASGLRDTAALAVDLLGSGPPTLAGKPLEISGDLRGLFAGGTLAQETLQGLVTFLHPIASNLTVKGVEPLADPNHSRGHTVVDLGDDALTVGRLHPMIDPESSRRRLLREAEDTAVGALLFDVVLGDGAHADPAGLLAPTLAEIKSRRPELVMLAIVVGTDADPQGLETQVDHLRKAGAKVYRDVSEALSVLAGARWLGVSNAVSESNVPRVDSADLEPPLAAINVGLESFHDSLLEQGARSVQMAWRPPAGGNERLLTILQKMTQQQ